MSFHNSPERASLVGTIVAERYEVRALLGEGGMARVYAAHDRKHDRPVAIKMLRDELTLALGADRFLREIRISARLSHPNILPLYDSGEQSGALYYVMPLIVGESLRERIAREGSLPLDDVVRLTREVAEALTYAHEQGFVHRDIKPDNIMLARGHALVADFGIARALSGGSEVSLTSTGLSLGTPLYMSPEQALSEPGLNYQTDIYSLGCVVYEMLTGRPPFIADTAQALLSRHISEVAPVLSSEFPAEVADVVSRALAKQPEDRFPTALSFAEALASGARTNDSIPPVSRSTRRTAVPWWRQPLGQLTSGSVRSVGRMGRRFLKLERWQQLGVLLLALFALFLATSLRPLRHTIANWESEAAVSSATESRNPWFGNWTQPVTMIALGDTAIGIRQGPVLLIFNGSIWTKILLPYAETKLARIGDRVWAFNGGGPGREQQLTAAGWVSGDSVPISTLTVWSRNREIVIAGYGGELAEQTGGGWRQLPSGRSMPIVKLFGSSRTSLTGLGLFVESDNEPTDSLVRREEAFWPSYVPQGSEGNGWVYQDGGTLADGSSMIVGFEMKGPGRQVPLILTAREGTTEWTRVENTEKDIPQHALDHLLVVGSKEILAWAEDEPGLLVMEDRRLRPVDVLRERHIRAATLLGTAPVVLTDVGSLMIRRGTTFEFYGEVPLRPRAGTGNLTHGELMALARVLGHSRLTVSRVVRTGSRKWILTENGLIYSAECRGLECEARIEVDGRGRAVKDLAVSGDRVTVVGEGALIRQWTDGRWTVPPWARRVAGNFELISTAANGGTIIARADSLFLVGPGESHVRALSTEGRGTPVVLAASADSGGMIFWNDYVTRVEWDGTIVRSKRRIGKALSSARFTCDGRIMMTSTAEGDPLMGGEAQAGWSSQYSNLSFEPLPIPIDLSDVTINSRGVIRLIGRGGVWLSTMALETAAGSCVDTSTVRTQGIEQIVLDW